MTTHRIVIQFQDEAINPQPDFANFPQCIIYKRPVDPYAACNSRPISHLISELTKHGPLPRLVGNDIEGKHNRRRLGWDDSGAANCYYNDLPEKELLPYPLPFFEPMWQNACLATNTTTILPPQPDAVLCHVLPWYVLSCIAPDRIIPKANSGDNVAAYGWSEEPGLAPQRPPMPASPRPLFSNLSITSSSLLAPGSPWTDPVATVQNPVVELHGRTMVELLVSHVH